MGIRFISINDRFDSLYDEYGIEHQFKTLNNDIYLKDLSNNIKKTFKTKMQNGTFIAAQLIFGYKKINDGKTRLAIDEEAAKIVKRVFEMAASYETPLNIARTFNTEGISTPGIYRKQRKIFLKQKDNFWHTDMIYSILHDERYVGTGIYKKTNVKKLRQIKQSVYQKINGL